MKILYPSIATLLFSLYPQAPYAEDVEEIFFDRSSTEFSESYKASVEKLIDRGFPDGLASPSLGATTDQSIALKAATILSSEALLVAGHGDNKITYDIIIQPGHFQRKTGKTGASGKQVTERAYVAYIAKLMAEHLRNKSLNVLVVNADQYSSNLKAKAFLAIHADGSQKQCKIGPSLGYSANVSPHAMHTIGWGLSQAFGYNYKDFERDSYTANSANYYMFKHVSTELMSGIVEVGEITCPNIERKLIEASDSIAANLARALQFIVGH